MAKRAQLVCQHLENISRDALEKYQAIIRRYVRNRQGVYALYRKGKLYYVGLASSLNGRLRMHLRDKHASSWDRFSVYLTVGDSHLKEMESLILRVVKPAGNTQKGTFIKSEDLRRRLQADFRAHQAAEYDAFFGRKHPTSTRPAKKRAPVSPDKKKAPAPLSKHISEPMPIRAYHKGKTLTARVRRDGTIRFGGQVYNSPSMAGAAAVKRKTCNGWAFWQYQRAPGDWVSLSELRR